MAGGIVFGAAARMVELHAELAARVQVYQDRLVVRSSRASFQVLPAVPKRLEGLDPTLAILDELGVICGDVYEVVSLASGKRESSLILGIGTPPADWSDSVLADMRGWAAEHPEDETFDVAGALHSADRPRRLHDHGSLRRRDDRPWAAAPTTTRKVSKWADKQLAREDRPSHQ